MNKTVKILHYSSHNEVCGIANYIENYIVAMESNTNIKNVFFSLSPNQTKNMNDHDFKKAMKALSVELKNFDILHIQHEFSFIKKNQLNKIIKTAKKQNVKIIVTYHTPLGNIIEKAICDGLGPRNLYIYFKRIFREFINKTRHVMPLKKTDKIIVHNTITKNQFLSFSIPAKLIFVLTHPVPELILPQKTDIIAKKLNKKSNDIILSYIGFIYKHKGAIDAVRCLRYLPDNYKLVFIGGYHPSDDSNFGNTLANFIDKLDLKKRVYITGYTKNENELHSLIQESDISLYPYDKQAYQGIQSGALTLALANSIPIIGYPTESFKEANIEFEQLVLTQSFNYYELAREIMQIDTKRQIERIKKYSTKYTYKKQAENLVAIYKSVL